MKICSGKFKAYGVCLAKSGTTSLAALFGRYRTAHEFMRNDCFKIIARYQFKPIDDEFRDFVKKRDALGNFNFESSCSMLTSYRFWPRILQQNSFFV